MKMLKDNCNIRFYHERKNIGNGVWGIIKYKCWYTIKIDSYILRGIIQQLINGKICCGF